MTPLLACNLTYQIGQKTILNGIDFATGKGSLIGIIGPNGAGKSSLLKMLCGYLSPTSGHVELFNQDLSQISSLQRATQLSYLPQTTRVEFPYRVSELVSLGLVGYSGTANVRLDKIDQVLSHLNILHLKDRDASRLSGGEQQLVHLARILLQDTPVVLLDEPCASLDVGHEAQLMNILYNLAATEDKTVIVALHNLNTAAEFCDRLLLLNEGVVLADGMPGLVLTQNRLQSLYPHAVSVTVNTRTGNPNILAVKEKR
jgi:iron complex transport system ATP-binding protein